MLKKIISIVAVLALVGCASEPKPQPKFKLTDEIAYKRFEAIYLKMDGIDRLEVSNVRFGARKNLLNSVEAEIDALELKISNHDLENFPRTINGINRIRKEISHYRKNALYKNYQLEDSGQSSTVKPKAKEDF